MDEVTRLAVAARDGDRAALEAFVRATQADVWRLVARLGDRGTADDLTQETYARALPALGGYRADAPARAWLLSIARRAAADAVRSSARRRRSAAPIVTPAHHPDHAAVAALDAAVAALEPDRRAAFVLTQQLGLNYEEAALACGCEVGTIRSRVARARAQLVAWLADDATVPARHHPRR